MTEHDDDLSTIAKLISASKIALVTTRSAGGALHSRPLGVQEAEFDGELWFFTQHPSPKTDDIASDPHVNAAFESGKGYLSIAGTATVVQDAEKIDELWSTSAEAWFPEGRDDPSVALLRVTADSAEYWSTDEPGVVTLFKVAKAAVTGGQPDVGENRVVDL
ncbi:pyridoxamine 5'-phosphate oxidase family protein [Herbiconiux moechotypicola]|uniref:Pyridoxamine 5'-phosphate oxidase family protein n=1 Tax=Herbiconiux moechotypicola TaxID=637393 RepID=A0ABP5QI94_9MICO|nr:pyridoxamine 5'-phosphate oxidase family protein [Herbiconiux moechotypicola]MCS5730179.1 pyridoxamine 5'-phosphate oxidase family protein [Herbiconiux moechotypicola]